MYVNEALSSVETLSLYCSFCRMRVLNKYKKIAQRIDFFFFFQEGKKKF